MPVISIDHSEGIVKELLRKEGYYLTAHGSRGRAPPGKSLAPTHPDPPIPVKPNLLHHGSDPGIN
jgi:hypothetical protein